MKFDPKDVEANKIWAALAYLWPLFLVPLLLRRGSPFAQAHAKQGFVLFVVQALSSLLLPIPLIGPLWNLAVFFVVPLYALVRALTGSYFAIPIVHGYARRLSFD